MVFAPPQTSVAVDRDAASYFSPDTQVLQDLGIFAPQTKNHVGLIVGSYYFTVGGFDIGDNQIYIHRVNLETLQVSTSPPIPSTDSVDTQFDLVQLSPTLIGLCILEPGTGFKFVTMNPNVMNTYYTGDLTTPYIDSDGNTNYHLRTFNSGGDVYIQIGTNSKTRIEKVIAGATSVVPQGKTEIAYTPNTAGTVPKLIAGFNYQEGYTTFLLNPSYHRIEVIAQDSYDGIPHAVDVMSGGTSTGTPIRPNVGPNSVLVIDGYVFIAATLYDDYDTPVETRIIRLNMYTRSYGTTDFAMSYPLTSDGSPVTSVAQVLRHNDLIYILTDQNLQTVPVNMSTGPEVVYTIPSVYSDATASGMIPLGDTMSIYMRKTLYQD
jgi:hypothetical protein